LEENSHEHPNKEISQTKAEVEYTKKKESNLKLELLQVTPPQKKDFDFLVCIKCSHLYYSKQEFVEHLAKCL